jgi:hypothetical protein
MAAAVLRGSEAQESSEGRGLEDEQHMDVLRSAHCDSIQLPQNKRRGDLRRGSRSDSCERPSSGVRTVDR